MSEIFQVGLMAAGQGTRVAPLYNAEQPEKSMLIMAEADPLVANDRGVRALDLVIGNHLIGLPALERLTILVNPNSVIPDYYQEAIKAGDLLRRQGRLERAPHWEGRSLSVDYATQPLRDTEHLEYGTCWGAHLLLSAMKIHEDEQVLIATGDDRLYNTMGFSPISELAGQLSSGGDKVTAGMLVSIEVPRYGAVRSEATDGRHYLLDIVEDVETGASLELPGKLIAVDKNVSTYVADAGLRRAIHEVGTTEPPADNQGERRITDAVNVAAAARRQEGGRLLVVRTSPAAYTYDDLGSVAGVQRAIEKSRGLRDARHPVWNYHLAA